MPVTHSRLGHLGDQCLGIAQEQLLQRTTPVELLLDVTDAERSASPALCTIARLGVVMPPMNSDTPTAPSNPTTAISADDPFSRTWSSETMLVVGKYSYCSGDPDS